MKKKMDIQNDNLICTLLDCFLLRTSQFAMTGEVKDSDNLRDESFSSVTIKNYMFSIKNYTLFNQIKNPKDFFNAVYQSNKKFFILDFEFIIRLARNLYIDVFRLEIKNK